MELILLVLTLVNIMFWVASCIVVYGIHEISNEVWRISDRLFDNENKSKEIFKNNLEK